MAKTPVTLKVDGLVEREVASFVMSFFQSTDIDGQVTDEPRGGKITLRVKSLNDGNCELICWMTNPKQANNGTIEFYDTKENKLMKVIKFKDAYCVEYREYWSDATKDVDLAHFEDFTISCREISNGGALKFKNTWELVK
jgi:hypothetical protein